MQWNDVYVNAAAAWLPAREEVKNAVAEGRYDAQECEEDGLIAVPVAGPDDNAADMAVAAGRIAVERSGVPAADFDLVLHATTSYQGLDHWTPGAYVQHGTVGGLAQAMEIKQTCNGAMAGLELGAAYVTVRPAPSAALITTGDKFALPQFDRYRSDKGMVRGDGATALVVSKQPGFARLLSTVVIGDTRHEGMGRGDDTWNDCSGSAGWPVDLRTRREQYVTRVGDMKTVMTELAIRQMECLQTALADAKLQLGDIAWFVFPNVGRGVAAIRNQAFGIDEKRTTMEWGLRVGHIGAGDQFGGLTHLLESGALSVGDRVMLSAAGGGWHFGAAVLEILDVPEFSDSAA